MTPFGFRKKLKGLVGGRSATVKDIDKAWDVVFVMPDGSEETVKAYDRYTLVMASQALPIQLHTGCPDGGCGTCTVEVLDGAGLNQMTDRERDTMAENASDAPAGTRLSCHARVVGPGVRIKATNFFDYDKIQKKL